MLVGEMGKGESPVDTRPSADISNTVYVINGCVL